MKKNNILYVGKHEKKYTGRKPIVWEELTERKVAKPEKSSKVKTEAADSGKVKPIREKQKLSTGKIAVITAAALLVFVLVAGVSFVYSKLDKLNFDDAQKVENISAMLTETEDAESASTEDEESPDDTLEVGDHEVRESGSEKATSDTISSSNLINILVIGSDKRIPGTADRGRADAVMLVSLDKASGNIKLVSFERAMGMPVEGQKDAKLNDLLNIGDAILIQKTISENFAVEIDGFVHLDYDSFPKVIDAIGGIDLEFDKKEASIFNGRITRDVHSMFVAAEGKNHLPGYEALVYCRLRDGDDNWARQGRTRAVLSAAVNKVKSLSIKELNTLVDTVLPMIHTNLTKIQISSIMFSAPKFLSPEISQLSIPDKDKIWVYHGEANEAMYGFDFQEETDKLHSFLLNEAK